MQLFCIWCAIDLSAKDSETIAARQLFVSVEQSAFGQSWKQSEEQIFFFLSIKDGCSSNAKALIKPLYEVVLNLGMELVVEKHFDFQMKEKVSVPLTNLCLH